MIILEDTTLVMLKAILLKATQNSGLVDVSNCVLKYDRDSGIINFIVKVQQDDIVF